MWLESLSLLFSFQHFVKYTAWPSAQGVIKKLSIIPPLSAKEYILMTARWCCQNSIDEIHKLSPSFFTEWPKYKYLFYRSSKLPFRQTSWKSHCGVIAKVLDCEILICKFEHQSSYWIHFQTKTCCRTSPRKSSNTVLRQLGSLCWLKVIRHATSSPSSVYLWSTCSFCQSKIQSAKNNNNPAPAAGMLFYASSGI